MQDIIRRNANFLVVRPTTNFYRDIPINSPSNCTKFIKNSKMVGILASEHPSVIRRSLDFIYIVNKPEGVKYEPETEF